MKTVSRAVDRADGADVNVQGELGRTALDVATVLRHTEIVRALNRPARKNAGCSSKARGTGRGAVPGH